RSLLLFLLSFQFLFLFFRILSFYLFFFLFNDPPTTEIYTLSLHDALPISANVRAFSDTVAVSELGRALIAASDNGYNVIVGSTRSEEHTSELQSPCNLVCRLLLEKKKKKQSTDKKRIHKQCTNSSTI